MFTGIIKDKGLIKEVEAIGESIILHVELNGFQDPEIGESIAIDGVCLTLNQYKNNTASFNLSKETILKTAFDNKCKGKVINWERALKLGEAMGGHIVLGHVDGIGTISKIEKIDKLSSIWTIEYPENLDCFISEKGSISVSGISLTIAEKKKQKIKIYLIEETLKRTNIESMSAGDFVNLEIDVISRYSLGKW
ncbi:riboflavin synthase [bacterium]|nr:riboflavin synthase [bacterium]|tara:strand:- start:5456 stop:6037 length:582 start_codon:yes stop_codon:yes gene_type:complete